MIVEKIEIEEIKRLMGKDKFQLFTEFSTIILEDYLLEMVWFTGGKNWKYECKIKSKSKTLCSFLFKEDVLGFMIIFGKDERKRFEEIRPSISNQIVKIFDETPNYHDGKWILIELNDLSMIDDLLQLLYLKKKPKRD